MIYLINTFNPHWEGHALPEWAWPKRRIFGYMLKLMDGPLSLGIGGLRRIGKTTLLKQLVGELNANRIPAKRLCCFQFDRDIVLKADDVLEKVLDAYLLDFLDESIGRIKEKTYIFLDEIQLVPRWSDIIKRYLDRDPALTFVVSGSSSLLLESDSAESLAGRLDMQRLSPPDFRDYKTINGLEPPPEFKIGPDLRKIPTQTALYFGANKARLTRAYLDYLRWGGFPQLKELDIDFIIQVQDAIFPAECKTGRLRSNDTWLIRSVAEKFGAPFSIMVTSETFDFSDPSILRVPALML